MKVMVYDVAGVPGTLKYVDIPDPITGPDDILIAAEAISIEGGDPINRRLTPSPLPSWVVGYMAAGTVVAVGSNARSRKVGDRVAAFHLQGSHAERWAVPAEYTWPIPDGVEVPEVVVAPISFVIARHCLFTQGMLRHGEAVLIQAVAGGVGPAAVQLASQAGAAVTVATSGIQHRSRLLELGADHATDRAEHNIADCVRQYTQGTGADFVIDPMGTTLPASLSALAPEGRLVFVGNTGGGSSTVDLRSPIQSNQTLVGIFMGPFFARSGVRASVDDLLRAVAAGRIKVVINCISPLANAAAAHEFAEAAKPFGRVVVKS